MLPSSVVAVSRAMPFALLLAASLVGTARAQSQPPASGNLQLPPPARHGAANGVPKPQAAPREPVHQAGPATHTADAQSHKPVRALKAAPSSRSVKAASPPASAPPPPAEPKVAEPAPATAEKPPEAPKGSATGLPLPRFAALRSDEVNLRAGPGTRYPIDWVYKRRDLPVQIEREFEVWRLIRDPDGTQGWVHQATLTGRRTFVVRGETRPLLRKPDDTGDPVAELKPGVVGIIRSCDATSAWCQVQVGEYRGFLKRDEFWGIKPSEAVN
jgi:SH3-like domain-containing protein